MVISLFLEQQRSSLSKNNISNFYSSNSPSKKSNISNEKCLYNVEVLGFYFSNLSVNKRLLTSIFFLKSQILCFFDECLFLKENFRQILFSSYYSFLFSFKRSLYKGKQI